MKLTKRGVPPALMPEILTIYRIPLPHWEHAAYMTLPSLEVYEGHSVVIVHAGCFLSIWNDLPRWDDGKFKMGVPYASVPALWKEDRKFKKMDQYFSHKANNPVPLARIAEIKNNKLYLVNGITRTLFLLDKGAWAFPIYCPDQFVDELKELAGATDSL